MYPYCHAFLPFLFLLCVLGIEYGDATISGVYFPSVEAYFLGEEKGKKAIVQNFEVEISKEEQGPQSQALVSTKQYKHQKATDFLAAVDLSVRSEKRAHSDSDESDPSACSPSKRLKEEFGAGMSGDCIANVSNHQDSHLPQLSLNSGDTALVRQFQHSAISSWIGGEQQKAIFAQRNGVFVSRSFFKLVDEAGRSGKSYCFYCYWMIQSLYSQ